MAIKDNRLKEFFLKQKVGAFDSLVNKNKTTVKITDDKEIDTSKSIRISTPPINQENLAEQTPIETKQGVLSVAKQDTNHTNIEISEPEPLPIRNQTVSKPLAIRNHTASNPLSVSEQTVINPSSDSLAKPLANIDEIHITDLIIFSKKERELLSLIFWQCKNHGALISPPISTEEIRNTLKITAERVRNLIHRIIKKGGLKIVQHRSGQSAYRIFELPKVVYQLMIDQQSYAVKLSAEPLAQPLANPLANITYSSNKYINTTTMADEWKKINFTALQHIGFSETQLRQLFDSKMIDAEIVQDSINKFAYGLEHNDKTKAYPDPLNILMGVLRKGHRWNEPNYVSPKELALRQLLEEKRKQKEQRDVMVKELIELEFPEWKRKLSEEELNNIVPAEVRKTNITAAITASLRAYYIDQVLLPRLEKDGLVFV